MGGAVSGVVGEIVDPQVFDPTVRYNREEAGFRALVAEIGQRLLQPRQPATAPLLVGVSGPGGSGKTTLTYSLADYFAEEYFGHEIPVVSADDFFPKEGDDQLRHTADWDNYDRYAIRTRVMLPLLNGHRATYPLRNWRNGESQGVRQIKPTVGLVLMEGVGLFHPDTRGYFDYKVWRWLPLAECMENGIRRMGEETRDDWQDVWTPNDQAFVDTHNPAACADFVHDTPFL